MVEQETDMDQLISKHSSGVSILIRIDGLWKDANRHSRSGLYYKWNDDLDVIWRELARDLSNTDYEEKKREFDSFDEQLIKSGKFNDSNDETFQNIPKEVFEKRSKQYKILNNKELFLKRLENFLGKGTTWDDGDADDFD